MQGQLSLTERLSYGVGNFGINLLFGVTGAYLMFFYTDVYHVAPGVVATLFLVARGVDAVFDPLLGLLIDRTDTRWGKHRPYLLWLAPPFAACGIAVFATPVLGETAKLVYIYASYTLLGMLYSGLSLPLNSMLPTLTRDPRERNNVNALREFLGSSAVVGVGYVTLPLVQALGGASQAKGFFLAGILFATITLGGVLVAFFNTRERIAPDKSPKTLTTAQSLRATRGNWPWIATMLVNFCFWVGFIGHVQSTIYYARDVLGHAAWVSPLMLTMVAVLVGTAISAFVANRIGKRMTGMVGGAITTIAMLAIPSSNGLAWVLSLNCVAYFGMGLIGGLLFALMADAVDYGEWKSGYRAQGFLFAASSFGVKLGMSVGGAAGAWLLSQAHYTPNVAVTPAVASAITWGHIWLPAISFALMGLSLILFTVDPAYARRASSEALPA